MSKAAKHRPCPAVAREITSAECGENRESHYRCPPSCVFNPFAPANYEHNLKLEEAVDSILMAHWLAETPDKAAAQNELVRMRKHPSPHALHAWAECEFFVNRDANNLTFAQRWEKAGFSGLNNDQRVLIRAKMQTQLRLLEIHRVIDEEQIEAVDLLEPQPVPLLFRDRSLAGVANRFVVALSGCFPLPHYWRFSGTAVILPEFGQFEPSLIVREIVQHLGGPIQEPEIRFWLATNLVQFSNALDATAIARRADMFASIDAHFGKAVYELRAPFAECRPILDGVPEVEPDNLTPAETAEGFCESRVWFESGPAAADHLAARKVVGRILLGQAHWRLETIGAANLALLRERFATAMGTMVKFAGERLDNVAADLVAKQPKFDRSLVPPRLLENPQQISLTSSRLPAPMAPGGQSPAELQADIAGAYDREFLDDSIPALDGNTPRVAARDPKLRPILIQLLKQRVRDHDRRNLETGRNDDINWLLRELGTDEILFDPPPLRPALRPEGDDESLNVVDDDVLLWPKPLPERPFSRDEALARLGVGIEQFDSGAEAIAEMERCGSCLIEDLEELTEGLLTGPEFTLLVTFLIRVWFAFVPPGFQGPVIEYDDLQAALLEELQAIENLKKPNSPASFEYIFTTGPQPAMMEALCAEVLQDRKKPKSMNFKPEHRICVLGVLRATIEVMDAGMRRDFAG